MVLVSKSAIAANRKVSMQNNQFELAVAIPRDGRSVKIREYGRNNLTFVEGRRGQPYSIQFRNNSPNRVMAIISVDGVDVVDGKPATAESRGYVVEGYASAEIKGWRTSTSEVRQFYFEDKQGSYSAGTTGETTNCGIIEIKVFSEKQKPLPVYTPPTVIREEHHYHHHDYYPYWPYHRPYYDPPPFWCGSGDMAIKYTCTSSGGDSLGQTGSLGPSGTEGLPGAQGINFMCNASSLSDAAMKCASAPNEVKATSLSAAPEAAPEFALGTGWGAAMTDCVNMTSFEKAYEVCSMAVYYTSTEALQKMGIVLDKEVTVPVLPRGFGGFCSPPKGIR